MSESLQGYSPATSSAAATTVRIKSETAGNESVRVNGFVGHEAQVVVASSDGTETVVTVWKTRDLDGFPARLEIPGKYGNQIVNLSNIKPTAISDRLFAPPDGFTAYVSTAAMTSELMMRQSKAHNSRPVSGEMEVPVGRGDPAHAPQLGR